jgi:hypothetical protein
MDHNRAAIAGGGIGGPVTATGHPEGLSHDCTGKGTVSRRAKSARIFIPAEAHAVLRDAHMRANFLDDCYDVTGWLYVSIGLEGTSPAKHVHLDCVTKKGQLGKKTVAL